MRPRQRAEQSAREFPGRLKAFRKARKLTQDQLAERAECSTVALSKFESGVNLPSFEILASLSFALEVGMDDLLGLDDSNTKSSSAWLAAKTKLDVVVKDLTSDWVNTLVEIGEKFRNEKR